MILSTLFKRSHLLKILSATFLLFGSFASAQSTSPIAADVIVVVDESGSMSGEQAWLRQAIPLLEDQLLLYGVGSESQENFWGLVGFGNNRVVPRSFLMNGELFGSAQEFSTVAAGLVINGGTEDGWRGIQFAIDEYPRRNGAALNIILATDEDRDNTISSVTYQSVLAALNENRALLNAVVNVRLQCNVNTPALGMDSQGNGYIADGAGGFDICENPRATSGAGASIAHYVNLALENGGAVWDLDFLRRGGHFAQSFTQAVLSIKVDEILNQKPLGDIVAIAEANPNPAVAGQSIHLNGANSFHQVEGRSIISWEWDLDNDGIFDVSGPLISTSFPTTGIYPVTLRVSDDAETPASAEVTVDIDVNLPPLKPTANIGGPYLFCPQNTPWRLDASTSSNPDDGLSEDGLPGDSITSYVWDLNNDLVFDDGQGALIDATSVLEDLGVGDHLVRLRVEDNTAGSFPSSGSGNLFDTAVGQVSILDASDARCNCLSDLAARPKFTKVQLTWTDSGTSAYAVYRSETEGGPYTEIARTDNRYSTYLDLGLTLDTTYYYVVSELGTNGLPTCRSREVSATPSARRFNNSNRAPVIDSAAVTSATEGVLYQYDVEASDPDARETLTFSLQLAPSGMTIDEASGLIQWTPLNSQVGAQSVVVRVADNQGLFDEQVFTINVANINQPPVINSTPSLNGTELVPYSYSVQALDPDLGDVLSYSLSVAPAGMTIDSATGVVSWTPAVGQTGAVSVTVVVTDSGSATDTQSFVIDVIEQNFPPSITSSPTVTGATETQYVYEVTATDPNTTDTLVYSLGDFPEGMLIDAATGLISWVPTAQQIGEFPVSVIVTDPRSASATQNFTISVVLKNTAPEFVTSALDSAIEDAPFRFTVSATDANAADGDVITYSIVSGPGGLVIDAVSGELQWLPTQGAVGDNTVVLRATDSSGLFSEETFVLSVANVNDAPDITSEPTITPLNSGDSFQYQVTALDSDPGDVVTFSLSQAPAGMTISGSGLIAWVPTLDQAGQHTVTVLATDIAGLFEEQTFSLSVAAAPTAPEITSAPVTTGETAVPYQYLVTASDVNGDVLTYSLTQAPTGMVIDATTGLISWTPADNQAGNFAVTVQVSDPGSLSDTQSFSIAVAQGNRAPQITSTPQTVALVGQTYGYIIIANDADGDALTYNLLTSPVGMSMTPAGEITWAPTNEQLGSHTVSVSVIDPSGAGVMQTYGILVALEPNDPPSISSVPGTSATVGALYTYQIVASDPNGDVLDFSLTQAPSGMTINSSGLIQWMPALEQLGVSSVALRVEDSKGGFATQSFQIGVSDTPNAMPGISSTPATSVVEGSLYTYQVAASDPDGDPLIYSLPTAPAGMNVSATGLVSWNPVSTDVGIHPVSVRAEDNRGAYSQQNFTLAVLAQGNDAPQITSVPVATAIEGELYQYQVLAQDIDGDVLGYALTSSPFGMVIDTNTGLISWTPASNQIGSFSARIEVNDGRGGIAVQEYSGNVRRDINLPLTLYLDISPKVVNQGDSVIISLSGEGGDGPLVYSLLVNGSPVALSGGQAIVVADQIGRYDISATLSDDINTVTKSAWFSVRDPNDTTPPTAEITSPVDNQEIKAPVSITGTANDENLAGYRLLLSPKGQNSWSEIDSGNSPVVNGILGELDTTMLKNGMYELVLEVTDVNGVSVIDGVTIQVEGELKLGPVQLSFTDMVVPLAGVPIVIERTYDSRVKTGRDLGIGWDLSVRQGSYTNNREPGDGWTVQSGGGFFNWPCSIAVEGNEHVTEIRISDTEVYEFRPSMQFNGLGSVIGGGCVGQVSFVQLDGYPGATLVPLESSTIFYLNGSNTITFDLGDERFGDPWEPENVRLTTPDGRVFDVNLEFGISRLADANGNQLFITSSGVINSSGRGVQFTRDSEGRITRITDPLGNSVSYTYDTLGNLAAFDNQLSEQTIYTYHHAFPHHLKEIILPNGDIVSEFAFDEDGRVAEVCDVDGCSQAEYDLVGRTQTNYDATGRATTYVYDEDGNVLSQTDELGNTTTYAYDAEGNLTQETDPNGNVTTQTWDANNNLLSRTLPHESGQDPEHFTTYYAYNAKGFNTQVRLPNGAEINKIYDTKGNVLNMTDESGTVLSEFTYDSSGRQVSETDAFGTVSTTYGSDGFASSITDSDSGKVFTFARNTVGHITSFTDGGETSTFAYDQMGRETHSDFGNGNEINYTYEYGLAWTSVEGNTVPSVQREFNAKGAPSKITQADGSEVVWQHDGAGRLISEISPGGASYQYSYDAAGRLVGETNPLGNSRSFELDPAGRILAVVSDGTRQEFTYYPDGKTKTMTDQEDRIWSFEYTPTSSATTDPLNRTVTINSNSKGQVTNIVNADGTTQNWTYISDSPHHGGDSLPESVTDEAGRTRLFGYDAGGRLASASDLAGVAANYVYSEDGLSLVTDAEGQTIAFDYNSLGNVTSVMFADGTSKEIQYDSANRVSNVSLASGKTKTLSYDLMGRILSENYSTGGSREYVWTESGMLQSAIDSLGAASYTYDPGNRLTQFTSSLGPRIAYTYDAHNRVTEQSISNVIGNQAIGAEYEYDDSGRLTKVIDTDGNETLFGYDLAGRLISREFPNGVTTTYVYDLRDQIVEISYANAAGDIISSVAYDRNVGGEPERITWHDGTYVEISYDSAVRVASETFYDENDAVVRVISYEYDLVGNRTALVEDLNRTEYSYGNAHRLQSSTGTREADYGYDVDGRITQRTDSNGTLDFDYNFHGQLTSVSSDSGTTISYEYDAQGRRIRTTENGQVRNYLRTASATGSYENPQAVYDDSGNLLQSYLYAGDVPLQTAVGSETYYYLTDAMGSVIGLVDNSGNLVGSTKYDAFGREFDQTGNLDSVSMVGGDFRYHGQWKDGSTGIYYMRARDYDPDTGRFMSSDPAEPNYNEPESLNRYLYANANPYMYSDPTGRFTMVSINISINIQSTLTSIAVHIARDYLIDKARSIIGSLVLSGLKQFGLLKSFDPWSQLGVSNPGQAGKAWEGAVQQFICSFVPGAMQDIVWFEPVISGGKATQNGYHCPGGGGSVALKGQKKPDFMLSKTEPAELDNKGLKAYLIGETKLSLKTFYDAYKKGGNNTGQFEEIMKFAGDRVYARTAVFLALYDGGKKGKSPGGIQAELTKILTKAAIKHKAVPVMVSAF